MKSPEEIKKGLEYCNNDFIPADGTSRCSHCPYDIGDEHPECADILHIDALVYIKQLEKQIPRWISVKAGLPKAYRNVDIVFGSHDSIGYYSPISKRWYDSHNIQIDGVTHWKYRDEPPKEDAHGSETGEKHEAEEMADEGPGEAGAEPV